MRRFAVVVAIVLATPLILIAVLSVILALILASPETYRDQITTSVEASTGYNLTIGGQLSWRYWPPIALEVTDVVIKKPGDDSPLANLEYASIDLDLLPLITGSQTISVRGLSLQGLALRPAIDKDGYANWKQSDETPSIPTAIIATDSAAETEKSPSRFALNIDGIDITDVSVDYMDEASGEHYILEITSLVTGPVQYHKPVTLEIEAQARDVVTGIRAITSIQGAFVFDENLDRLGFTDLSLSNSIHLPDMAPVVMVMALSGELDIAKQNLEVLLNVTLDDSTITGSFEITSADVTRLAFDLTVDTINVSHYLASDVVVQTQQSTTPAAPNKVAIKSVTPTQRIDDVKLIPVERLSAYDVQGNLSIGTLDYDTYSFSDLTFNIQNSNGKFHTNATFQGHDGHVSIEVDSFWKNEIRTSASIKLKKMDMSKLTESEWITGKVDANSELTFQGTMLSDAMETLDGTNQFTIENGTLDITPVKQLATTIDLLRGKQSSISQWPDKMPFEQLKGHYNIHQGTRENQSFDFTLENIQANGKGGFDYFANHLQYDIAIKLSETENSEYSVSPALANIRWPVHCEGAMDASPADLCFPNSKSIETLVKDIAKQELKRKGKKKLKDLLKGIFRR